MKKWYVVQVFAGYENIVKTDIFKGIEEESAQDLFGDILVPSAKMKQFFDSGDAMKDQQLFPGYVLVQMEPVQEATKLVSSTNRVVKILGSLSSREIERIQAQVRGEVVVSGEKHAFEVGREIDIQEGPFAGFVGLIETIDEGSEKLTVMVSILGRMTPVELSFDQVKR